MWVVLVCVFSISLEPSDLDRKAHNESLKWRGIYESESATCPVYLYFRILGQNNI
jgi:hypothetical protein